MKDEDIREFAETISLLKKLSSLPNDQVQQMLEKMGDEQIAAIMALRTLPLDLLESCLDSKRQ